MTALRCPSSFDDIQPGVTEGSLEPEGEGLGFAGDVFFGGGN